MDFRIPDNAGIKVRDQPVVKNGPAAYFSTLPVRALIEALRTAGIPSELSLSAGSYLCNQVFYSMMHHITINNFEIRAGFIHLPALPEQAAAIEKPIPSLGLEIEVQALRIMLSTLINTPQR
jgi:pyroglutamyl-peptidase